MATKLESFFQFVSAQRYFHLLAFNIKGSSYNTERFWKDCGFKLNKKLDSSYDREEFVIQHRKIISDVPYSFGETSYSVNEDGNAPFNYDIFLIHIKKYDIFLLGFPFKDLAIHIMTNLQSNGLGNNGNFIRPDLDKLIRHKNASNLQNGAFSTFFSALELTLTGETELTSINLDGDKPMESTLYKDTFADMIQNGECKVESCSLKCELTTDDRSIIPKTKSSVYMQVSGNFKLYVHGSGNNVFTLPYLFVLLKKYNCLLPTSINPVKRLNDDKQLRRVSR